MFTKIYIYNILSFFSYFRLHQWKRQNWDFPNFNQSQLNLVHSVINSQKHHNISWYSCFVPILLVSVANQLSLAPWKLAENQSILQWHVRAGVQAYTLMTQFVDFMQTRCTNPGFVSINESSNFSKFDWLSQVPLYLHLFVVLKLFRKCINALCIFMQYLSSTGIPGKVCTF